MPRGKYTNHKGRNRKFTSPEELEEQRKQEEQKQRWRKEHGGESSSEEESAPSKSGSGSSDESDSDEDNDAMVKCSADVSETMEELAERDHRACNVILVGAPDIESDDAAARQQYDEDYVAELITSINVGLTASDVVKVVKLGTSSDKPRWIKIIMKSKESAIQLLKNSSKLPVPLIAFGDQTFKQRQERRQELQVKCEELKARFEKGETDVAIKYVKGVLKIVKHPTKAKGVSGLIEVENPNRVVKKNKKLSNLNTDLGEGEKPQLSRREREEIERQRAAAAYQKAHAEGKTDQARADLARLAIIRQQREEAAKRREADKKSKDEGTTKKR